MRTLQTTLLALALITTTAMADTIFLEADGSGDFPTIQDALNAAASGDVIQLAPGIYTGPGNLRLHFRTNVTLEGTPSWEDCLIDAYGDEGNPQYIFNLTDETGGTIRNLSFRRAYWTDGAVAHTSWGHYVFSDCQFVDNHATGRGGAWYGTDGGQVEFIRCQFANNTADISGGALAGFSGTDLTVQKCTLACNGAPEGGGIYLGENAAATVTSSVLAWSRQGGAVFDWYSAGFDISCTLIHGNRGGDWANGAGSGQADDNMSFDPELVDPAMVYNADLHPTADSPLAQLYFPCGRIGALDPSRTVAPTYEVKSNGSGMFSTIQAAIDAVPSNAHIALTQGIYRGEGMRDLDFRGKDLTIEGRLYSSTRPSLDAMADPGGPYRRHFNLDTGVPASPRFRFLHLWRGYTEDEGGSVRIGPGSAPVFDSVIFSSNGSVSDGGALHIDGTGHDQGPRFIDCEFRRNNAEGNGGAVSAREWDLDMVECVFEENESLDSGGALDLTNCNVANDPGDEPNHFEGNSAAANGGAIRQTGTGGMEVHNWTFHANLAGMGGALHTDADHLGLHGTEFDANEANHAVLDGCGGGVRATCDTILLDNVTFVDNVVQGHGGGLMATARHLAVTGGLLQANEAGLSGSGLHFEPVDSAATLFIQGTDYLDNVTPMSSNENDGGAIFSGPCVQQFHGLEMRGNTGAITGGIFSLHAMAGSVMDSCLFQQQTGAAVRLLGPREWLVQNSHFLENQGRYASGLDIDPGDDPDFYRYHVTVEGCLFEDNVITPITQAYGELVVRNTRFTGNTTSATAGAIYASIPCVLENCVFENNTNNSYGAGAARLGNDCLVQGCAFVGNQTIEDGGGLQIGDHGTIENSVFFDNASDTYGTAISGGSGLVLRNCTVVANRALLTYDRACQVILSGWDEDGVYEPVEISHCIISHGQGCSGIYTANSNPSASPEVTCSTIWHNEEGPGFDVEPGLVFEPRLCDWRGGDLTLAADSACLPENNPCAVQIGALGRGECSYPAPVGDDELPTTVELRGNYPNPFNPSTVISFALPAQQNVHLKVYDVQGRLVRTLVEGQLGAGRHQVPWNGRDDGGATAASGVYFYRLETNEGTKQGKMVMLK
jgi:hypothetical protein